MITPDAIRDAFGFGGSVVVPRSPAARPVVFYVDLDPDQVAQRRSHDLRALTDRALINALWEIPEGLDYPRAALPRWILDRISVLRSMNSGSCVRREVRPPLQIRAAAGIGANLQRLLDYLGPLSAVCPTAAVLTSDSPDYGDPAFLDARLFGVGVGVLAGEDVRVLCGAGAVELEAGPYQWHLAEMLYSELENLS